MAAPSALLDDIRTPRLRLVLLSLPALRDGDMATARAVTGLPLPPEFAETPQFWGRRLTQLDADPTLAPWLVRAIVRKEDGAVIGDVGLHDAPRDGVVEAGYSVVPAERRRGYASEAAAAFTPRRRPTPR